MAQPTTKDMHIDAALTNISVAYRNMSYIADRIFPIVPVVKQSDKYYYFHKGPWFRDDAGIRAPGTAARRGGYSIADESYYCNEYAFAKEIADEELENADAVLSPDRDAVDYVTNQILLHKEKLVATAVLAWAVNEDANAGWAAGTGNTFIADIRAGREEIRAATGVYPNKLVIDSKTLEQLKEETTILDKIKYVERGIVSAPLIAAICELDEVIIGTAVYSSAEETQLGTDFTAVDIWEKTATKGSAFLYYVPPAPGRKIPSAGYCFRWKDRQVKRWREEDIHSDVVEASENFDILTIGSAVAVNN